MPDGGVPIAPPVLPPIIPTVRKPPEPPPKPIRYVEARWLTDGMIAYIRWNREQGTLLKVRVVCAMGHHGRVVNTTYEYDRVRHIDDILVPDTEPQATVPDMAAILNAIDNG
jgi:hypothetical protein